ncbi:MAG: hypothetical protein WKF96_09160 [Solirubrobacteraceae bacterium]
MAAGEVPSRRPAPRASSVDVFQAHREAFRGAAERSPEQRYSWRIAERNVEVRVAGPRFARVLERALGHLPPSCAGANALEAELWTEDETGVARPELVSRDDRNVSGEPGVELRARSADARYVRYERPPVVLWFDRQEGRAVGWCRSVSSLNQYERGRPLHPVFCEWLADAGLRLLHGALVVHKGAGVLLQGAAGSGKTTAALACAAAGLNCVGEDVLALSRRDGRWVGHGIYSTGKLDPCQLVRLPAFAAHVEAGVGADEPKLLVFAGEALPGCFVADAEIVALAFPRVAGRVKTSATPIRGGEGLRELLAETLPLAADVHPLSVFEELAGLARDVPAFRLDLGTDLAAIPAVLAELASTSAGTVRP